MAATSSPREYWSDDDIKCLLAVFKTKKHLFDSNSIKNDDVWKTIEVEMEAQGVKKTSLQIKNKINNMKKTYKRAKDNDNKTGAAPSRFRYMECFEELFGRDYDINPISYAESSSRQPVTITLPIASSSPASNLMPRSTTESPDMTGDTELAESRPKRRRTNSESFMFYLKEIQEEKKEYRKYRDECKKKENEEKKAILKDAVEVMKEGNAIFKDMMLKILDKL